MKHFLLLTILGCAAAFAQGPLPDQPHIYVEGSAEVSLDPDTLRLSGEIEVISSDPSEAERDVYAKSAQLLKACKDAGIDPEQITASTIQMAPKYSYSGGRQVFQGYRISRSFEILVRPLDNYYPLLRAIVESDSVSSIDAAFTSSESEAVIKQAQLAAIDDARERAERLAKQAGARIGKVHSITEFNLRDYERSELQPQRFLFESDLGGDLEEIVVTARKAGFYAEPLFEPDQLAATATVFVVYLLKE